MADRHHRTGMLLLLVIVLAAGVRLYGIGQESYWLDEAISIRQVQHSFPGMMRSFQEDVHLPLYPILLWGWTRAFGISETATRMLSAIFGMGAVVLTYLLGKRLYHERVGLIAALLVATSPLAIAYSQETRLYSLFLLLALGSMHSYARFLERKTLMRAALYAITSILLLYTHVFAVILILIQAGHLFWRVRWERPAWFALPCIVLLSFIPWIPTLTRQVGNIAQLSWTIRPVPGSLLWIFRSVAGTTTNTNAGLASILSAAILAAWIALLVFAIAKAKPWREKGHHTTLLVAWLVLPPLAVYAASLAITPVFHPRYFLFILPAGCILVGWAMTVTLKSATSRTAATLALAAAALIIVGIQASSPEKDDWRALADYLHSHRTPNDVVFIHPFYQVEPFTYYYDNECFGAKEVTSCTFKQDNVLSLDWQAACCTDATRLAGMTDRNALKDHMDRPLWLISVRAWIHDRNLSLYSYIASHKNLTENFSIGDIEVYRFS